jgi:GNAT superfamily N-acetyltransferase
VEIRSATILIIDIVLLSDVRSVGIGAMILRNLISEADRVNLLVILRVELFNPIVSLYTQLGFVKTREVGICHEMVWTQTRNLS